MKEIVCKRNYALDVTRIVAVLAVVIIHCCAPFVTNYETHMAEFIFGNLFDSIARLGVPLFLMISGALFLDERKEITLKGILSKNVKNIAVITIVWSVIYSVIYNILVPFLKGNTIDIAIVIDGIVNGHGHMWYLYMIMGIYVITPFLKKIVCKENRQMVLSFIAISFVVQFLLPTLDMICLQYWDSVFIGAWIDKFHLDFFSGYITYYLVGWYIAHVGIKQNHLKYTVYSLGLISLLFLIFYVQFTGDHKNAYEYIGAPVFLYSTGVFLLLNNIKFHFTEKTSGWIIGLSKLSFGAYILHVLILNTFCKIFPYSEHCVLYLLISFVVVTCSSFLSVYVMSKIPFTKKLIKM